MTALDMVLGIHTLSTIMMAGLIWFVQVVHYPLMRLVGESSFTAYARRHTRRTTWIVAPLMWLEVVSAALLPPLLSDDPGRTLAYIGWALLVAIWLSTACLQVPCHRRLTIAFNPRDAARLVTTNWIRTIAWSARAGLAVAIPLTILADQAS